MLGSEFVDLLTDARKVGKEGESPLEPSVVRRSLIGAECGGCIIVNVEKLAAGAN